MKKLLVTGLVGLVLVLSACSSGGGGNGGSATSIPVNNAPTANVSSLSIAVNEGSTGTLNVASHFSDANGDTLVYTLAMSDGSSLPSVYSIDSATGVITVTVPSNSISDGMNIEHNLSVVASDGEANATMYVIATLQDIANDSKIVASEIVADENVTVGDDLNVSLSVADVDGISSVTYSLENSSLVSVTTGVLSDINSDGNYSVSVDTGSLGEGKFTIVVNAVGVVDGEKPDSNVTKSHAFSVLALDTTPPVLSTTTKSFTTVVGTALTLESVTATDGVDGVVNVVKTGSVDFNTIGVYTVTYRATDSSSNSTSVVHTYNVTAVPNSAPTASDFTYANSGNPFNSVQTDSWLNLSGANDVDDDTLTATIKTQGSKGVVSISGNDFSYTPSADVSGNDIVALTISDGSLVVDVNMSIENIDTVAPVVTLNGSSTISITQGGTYTEQGAVSDDGSSVVTSGTVDTNTVGTYTVTYTATDSAGNVGSASRTVNVVAPAVSTPTISLADQTVSDDGGATPHDLPAPTVTNVNSGAVYSIVSDPTGGKLTINASTGVATWNGDLYSDTDYSITIKVVNTDGGTSSTTFTLTVINNG